uniref:Uncharacterized protein n=1 Tax=Rhizophora mucronata TaxID=61149 RepID=A0A2P2KY94_RHIMU
MQSLKLKEKKRLKKKKSLEFCDINSKKDNQPNRTHKRNATLFRLVV